MSYFARPFRFYESVNRRRVPYQHSWPGASGSRSRDPNSRCLGDPGHVRVEFAARQVLHPLLRQEDGGIGAGDVSITVQGLPRGQRAILL